uniref:DUF6729 domain-containing protein n=1 Tax=Mycena chlorophos TaxID=658473 RepID=A0ABQ0KVW6_MYCCL|nr:predicted protein [Mycena chlorophos]
MSTDNPPHDDSQPLTTTTGKRHANPNWGGCRTNAGRPPKKAKTASDPNPAPVQSTRPPRRARDGPVPLKWRNAALAPFFQPRRNTRPMPWTSADDSTVDVGPSTAAASASVASSTSSDPAYLTASDYTSLTDSLTFIQENDEFADIASGENVVDESMLDDLADSSEENANTATQDYDASASPDKSAHQTQLENILLRIRHEIAKHGQPLCYARGDLFDRARHPLFAVRDSAKHGFKPDLFCHLDVFVWIPWLLPGAPDTFKCSCSCSSPLVKKGWNSDPIARRVKSFPRDFFLLTNRFRCPTDRISDPGCGKSFQGTDVHIISQLPRFTQTAFPAFLSTGGALDKVIVSLMSCTFATRFGPAPCSELLSELQYKHHDEVELMYVDGARHYNIRGIPKFSPVGDRMGWDHKPTSVQYLKAMFVDWATAQRVYWERGIACLPGQLTKYMGGLGGEKIHTAAHTMNNEFEEIRKHALVPSKAYEFLEDSFVELAQGLKEHRHPQVSVLYTDSPQSEYGFLEKLIPSLKEDVSHITKWTDLTPFSCDLSVELVFKSDTLEIEDLCSEILDKVRTTSDFSIVAMAIQYEVTPSASRVSAIQLRTDDKNLVFDLTRFTSRVHFPPALRAILTTPSIIKLGCGLRRALSTLAAVYDDEELRKAANARGGPLLELGLHAKLKGVLTTPTQSLHALVGIILERSFAPPRFGSAPPALHDEVEAIWQCYLQLVPRDSVGLPLTPEQSREGGRLVTVVHGNKPVAEGIIIGQHPGYIDVAQPAVLTPNSIHRLHAQTVQFICDNHGGQMVVAASMLRTRSSTSPMSSTAMGHAFSAPADEYTLNDDPIDFSDVRSLERPDEISGDHMDESDIDISLGAPEADNLIAQTVTAAQDLLQAAAGNGSIPTRVLDDVFHFMDRLLRLLSKLHTAFKPFCAHFSESIFLRDKDDEAAVRAILESKGISWEWAKHAMSTAINRRIRRYVPACDILEKRLRALFDVYRNLICSTNTGRSTVFFSKEANEMAERLLETVRRGFLSDPVGVHLYYKMYVDRDGLVVYRTVRGTNSVEGGVHMAVRRVFGSLQASPELAEAILLNWIHRHNKKVGTHNRSGRKYRGHFDIALIDEICEVTADIGVQPSFPPPPVFATRIATSETFGIRPIALALAKKYNITTLPARRIEGLPHHHDIPVHTLTRLFTTPTNRYRSLQFSQRTLHCVAPVHTPAEYAKFRSMINDTQFRKSQTKVFAAHEAYKNVDYERVALAWNSDVDKQNRSETDSNKRTYYKFACQLEHHHKKVLLSKSQRATLLMGSNAAALKPFFDMLNDTVPGMAPAALDLPDGPADASISSNDFDHLDHALLDTLNLMRRKDAGPVPTASRMSEMLVDEQESIHVSGSQSTELIPAPPPARTQQTLLSNAESTPLLLVHPSSQPSSSVDATKRCARCAFAYCPRRHDCPGRGNRKNCHSDDTAHSIPDNKKCRWSEAKIEAEIKRRVEAASAGSGTAT